MRQQDPEAAAVHVRSLVLRGSQFVIVGQVVSHGLRLLSNVVLARLLFPEAFGLMALVAVFMQGLQMFSDVGIQSSIVQSPRGEDPAFLDTAWTIQILRGLLLWACACALAWPFATAYREPQLLLLIPVAAMSAVMSGFEATALHTASRNLKVGTLTLLDLITQTTSIVVTVAIAAQASSVWALVIGGLASNSLRVVLSHTWIAERRNRFRLERDACASLLSFGKWIFVSTALTFLVGQGDKLVLARLIPLDVLGVYAIASTLATLPAEVMSRFVGTVVFPAYCRSLEPRDKFAERFASMRTPLVSLGLLGISVICIVAPVLVEVLYDSRYREAKWMIQALLIGITFRILENINGAALLAMGNSRLVAVGSAAKLGGMLSLMLLGYWLNGYVGAIVGYSLSEVARYCVSVIALRRYHLNVLRQDSLLIGTAALSTLAGLGISSSLSEHAYSVLTVAVAALLLSTVMWWQHLRDALRAWRS